MEQALADLVLRGVVSLDEAMARTTRGDQLLGVLQRAGMRLPEQQSASGGLRTVAS